MRDAIHQASHGFVERRLLIETIVLAALAGENVLIVGPAGTGRSIAARRVARILGGRYFEYLLGRSADPLELFGPIERRGGASASFEDRTGMLADAEVAFLEEVFEVQTTMLNHLQWFLSERVFRRGAAELPCALKVCVGTATTLDESPALRSYDERFLLRLFVQPIDDGRLESLLSEGWARKNETPIVAGLARTDRLAAAVDSVEWPVDVRRAFVDLVRRIRAEGVELADSRVLRAQRLIAARAVLEGRSSVNLEDITDIVLVVRTLEGQQIARRLATGPRQNTLRPSSPIESPPGMARTAEPTDTIEEEARPGRPRSLVRTDSYGVAEMRAMLGHMPVKDRDGGSQTALPAVVSSDDGRLEKKARPSLQPPSRRPSAPPSAGRAAMPESYKRVSVPPSAKKAAPSKVEETKAFGAFEKPRAATQPVEPERSTQRDPELVKTGERLAKRRPLGNEPARLEAIAREARTLLRTTTPDGGAALEDWRSSIEAAISEIDHLALQGVSSESTRMLKGMLVDALDASWRKGASTRAG